MQGLGNCLTRTLKPTTEESLETSRAITRFFERFYCPTVMLVRDRTLEKRAEGSSSGSGVFCKKNVEDTERKSTDEVNVLSSDLDGIKLKDECSDCAQVSSTIKIQDDPSDRASAPCVPCAEKLKKLEDKPQVGTCEVLGETELESYEILREPEADKGYEAAKELEVEGFLVSEDVSGEAERKDNFGSTEPEVYVISEQDSKDVEKRRPRTRFNGGKSRMIKKSLSVDANMEESDFVDLTSDEPRTTWKQTILKRYCDEEDSKNSSSPETVDSDGQDCGNDSRESRIMIADSSSKSQRENSSTSLATALRDRGPCVIPVQPNHSLPLRPVPPAPMRSSLILKPAVLKLSKPLEMEKPSADSSRSSSTTTTTNLLTFANEDSRTFQFGEPARLQNFVTIAFRTAENQAGQGQGENQINDAAINGNGPNAKRKVGEEAEKVGQKESKKRRKSHEADSSQSRIDGEFLKNSTTDKNGKTPQVGGQEAWSEKNYGAAPPVVSTTDDNLGKDKESAKTVPPLRLKKIVCEGSSEGNRTDEVSAMSRNETNYRIVTGATPQPPASVPTSTILFWTTTTSVINEQRTYKLPTFRLIPQEDTVRRSPTKNDGYKLKYRRNRLKQKLRELRTKRIDLDQQMANVQETNPLQSTRLKQMMNCNEKQMENLSKLLKKLCDTTAGEKTVNVDGEGDGVNLENVGGKENAVDNIEPVSPEPPKLSPTSPLDYAAVKSPGQLRDSPPVLPRVCLTIPSNLGNDLVENLRVATPVSKGNAWQSPERSPSHLSIVLDVSDEENQGPSIDDTLTKSTPVGSSSSQGLSMPIIDTEGSEPVNTKEVIIVNRPEENTEAACTFPRPSSKNMNPENLETSNNDDIFELFGFALPEVQGNTRFAQEDSNANNLVSNGLVGQRAEGNNTNEIYAQIVPSVSVQQQVSTVGNALQNQTNHYQSAITQENDLGTGFVEQYQNVHTVTSSSNQPVTTDSSSTIFSFDQTNSVSDVCPQRSIPAKKGNNETIEGESLSRNDESRFISEQFPTLGNWVKSRAKNTLRRNVPKVKPKKTPDLLIATPIEDNTVRILDTSKIVSSSANIPARNIAANATTPQWNAERWQHFQQRQQRPQQQQLLQQVPTKTGQPLPPRPGICPPISVTQFYPTNYAIELYENPAFRYHSTICPYNNYQCRLHPGLTIGGYHPPIHDPTSAGLRPTQHVDKRLSSLVSQDPMRQHYTADMLKYHSTLPPGGYNPNGLDYERCRTQSTVRNGATVGCLPPLLLPPAPPPNLATSSQQSLPRASMGGLAGHNVQYGRNRMIPDVVAAAAAAAVVAAASLGQQNNPLTPCNRADRDANAAAVMSDFISGEAARLCKTNNNCDRLTAAPSQANGSEDSRHNGATNVYQKFRNLEGHGNRVNVDGNYATSSTFANNVSTTVADVAACQMTILPAPRMQEVVRNEPMMNQTIVFDTPNLEKVGRSPNVTNTLQCSSCGLSGSLFKCLGCETAFYCNERCQERHWIIHGEKCPKKMPKLKKVA